MAKADPLSRLRLRAAQAHPYELMVGWASPQDLLPQTLQRLAPGLSFWRFPQPRSRRTLWYFQSQEDLERYRRLAEAYPRRAGA